MNSSSCAGLAREEKRGVAKTVIYGTKTPTKSVKTCGNICKTYRFTRHIPLESMRKRKRCYSRNEFSLKITLQLPSGAFLRWFCAQNPLKIWQVCKVYCASGEIKLIHTLTQSQSQRPLQANVGEIFTEKMEMWQSATLTCPKKDITCIHADSVRP